MLNEKILINQCEIKNRLVLPPMATGKADDGNAGEAIISYYTNITQSKKIGLVITEHACISERGRAHDNQMRITAAADLNKLHQLTDAIHSNDSKVFAQISHAGFRAACENPLGASAVPDPFRKNPVIPEEASSEDLQQIISDFASAALRCKKAGYDGVEIHSAHGYLLNQFYSPLSNKRTDAYGQNRILLHLQVIQAVRAAVGPDYPVIIRLGACDYAENGSSIEDAVQACIAFEKAGIDAIDVTGGLRGYTRPDKTDCCYFEDASSAIKNAVSVPVIAAGGIRTKDDCERLLSQGACDLAGIARPLLKDPFYPDQIID